MYVLDTNTLIFFFKGRESVSRKLLSIPPKEIGIPSVVVYELEVGIAKSKTPRKRLRQLEEMMSLITILPFTVKEARSSALIRAQLERKGRLIGPIDMLISGTALAHQAILVTHNVKEFTRIDKLQIEDWYV
ncbi:MAG: nucleic acid-binding protein [Nitrospirales bacterium]|nr:MAG: nucleic acid-binding protein [Nitrospirales bacterium]